MMSTILSPANVKLISCKPEPLQVGSSLSLVHCICGLRIMGSEGGGNVGIRMKVMQGQWHLGLASLGNRWGQEVRFMGKTVVSGLYCRGLGVRIRVTKVSGAKKGGKVEP